MNAITTFAKQAADNQAAEKLARDTGITPKMVHDMARAVNMSSARFTKLAYDDPQSYTIFLNVLSGRVKVAALTKGAGAGKLVQSLLGAMKQVGQAGKAAVGAPNTLKPGGIFGSSAPANNPVSKVLGKSVIGGSTAGRATMAGTTGGVAGYVGNGLMGGGKPAGPVEQAAAQGSAAATAPKPQASPMPGAGATPSPEQSTNPQGAGGMSTGAKVGLGAAGVGAGIGAGALMRKKKKTVQASDNVASIAKQVMRDLIEKKAAEMHRNNFCTFLDTVVKHMPLEKSAAVRTIQSEVAKGKPIAQAIKVAYPHLNGDARGILASDLVRRAVSHTKKASSFDSTKFKTTEKKTQSVKQGPGGFKMKELTS